MKVISIFKLPFILFIFVFKVLILNGQTGCCRPPDSLKLTSITTNRFCVSWQVKDSFPCDSITASIIQFRKVGTATWTTKTVNFPKGQKLISFCDSIKPCTQYQWQVRNICKKIDSSYSSWKTGPNFTSFCDTSSCCRVSDSLKFVSWNGTQFCVSWSIKDSMPCDSSIGATIRYKKEGTTTWKTVDVTYTAGQKKYTYCDTATNCRYYDWQVRTKCKRMGVITYSAYKNGPQFLLNKNCGPIPRSAPVVNAIDDDALKLLINPNPVTSELTVSTNKLLSGSYQLTIVDAVGRTRVKQNVVVSQKMLQVKLSTGKLGSGVYYVIVKGRDEVIKRSFVSY